MKKRRDFLKSSLALACGLALPEEMLGLSLPVDKTLNLYNIHTGEFIKATFWQKDHFVKSEIARLNHFLRDYRINKTVSMDVELYPLLYAIALVGDTSKPLEIISGYRSIQTNNRLRKHSKQIAKGSFHTRAQAVDFNIKDRYLKNTLKVAMLMKTGGVGYYPKSQFIHVDTGPVRHWSGA